MKVKNSNIKVQTNKADLTGLKVSSLEEKIGQALAEMYKDNQEKEKLDKGDASVKFN